MMKLISYGQQIIFQEMFLKIRLPKAVGIILPPADIPNRSSPTKLSATIRL